jgi:hypothetical protein
MVTFVVCTRCGKVCETTAPDQIPKRWKTADKSLLCPSCADPDEAVGDILDEEVIYPSSDTLDEAFDEGFCEVCGGPCQGH